MPALACFSSRKGFGDKFDAAVHQSLLQLGKDMQTHVLVGQDEKPAIIRKLLQMDRRVFESAGLHQNRVAVGSQGNGNLGQRRNASIIFSTVAS